MKFKKIAGTSAILAACASTAFASGIDRNSLKTSILFEEGNYIQGADPDNYLR